MASLPTRPLIKADLKECIVIWEKQPDASISVVSSQTRLSRQRVNAARKWLLLSHLINSQGLTNEGKLVLEKDPYFESTVTDWLIHFFCSFSGKGLQPSPDKPSDWGFCTFAIYDFLVRNSSFTKGELLESASQFLESSASLKEKVEAWLKTYTQENAIQNCQFLVYENSSFATGKPNLRNSYTIGYLLASIWKRDFGKQGSILINDLIDTPMGLSTVLGVKESELREQLDRLAELEIIEQRSAKPHKIGTQPERRQQEETSYVVVRCWDDSLELLAKAYEQDPAVPNRPLLQSLEEFLDDDSGELPFLSSVQAWLSSFCPKQSQPLAKNTTFNPPLHLAS